MRTIEVIDYEPKWKACFEELRSHIHPVVKDLTLSIEHVGSTSVPGLAAKPIIDLDIVVASSTDVPAVIERLSTLGYVHRGDLGIEGREAFKVPAGSVPHNLYVCVEGNLALENHLAVRDYLRLHPAEAKEYSLLKKQLAKQFCHDIDSYTKGKTDFLIEVLKSSNFSIEGLASIERSNKE